MPNAFPLSSARIEDLSEQLQKQAETYAKARLERGVDDNSFDVAAARAALSKTQNFDAVELDWTQSVLGGVSVRRTPKAEGPILLYIHGGGFVGGDWGSHAHICDHLCRVVGLEGVFVEYRLAPEHPFPAAFEDVEAVFRALPDDRQIVVAGDSVGGALSLYLAQLDRDAETSRIQAVALMAPMLDFDETTSDYMKNYGRARAMIANAISRDQLSDPRLQVLNNSQECLPPILIQAGGADYVQDDGHRLSQALLSANSPTTLEHWPHMPHVWHRYTPDAPEAFNAVTRAGLYLSDHLSGNGRHEAAMALLKSQLEPRIITR